MYSHRTGAVALAVMLAGGLVTRALAQSSDADRSIEQYSCKDILREAGANRDVAIAFLHGYLLGKSGSSKFNVEALEKQTDAFIERCLDNPQEKAQDAMQKAKG
jgi:hypothetical protein